MNRRGTVGTLPLSWDVLLDTPVVAQSAPSVLGQYDIALLDQFGVLHDGKRPIPGAVECVEALLSAGKGVVVCSNSSQRKELALSRWVNMGFPGDVGFLTSGEVSFQHLKKMLKQQGEKKQKVLVFSWHDPALTANWLEGLDVEQLATSDAVETADLLLFHGPDAVGSDRVPLGLGDEGAINEAGMLVLERAARAGIKAVCANIDLKAVDAHGNIRWMPGNLLEKYKELGGECLGFGKPKEEFFNTALEMAISQLQAQCTVSPVYSFQVIRNGAGKDNMQKPGVRLVRAIHVGDSLEHDIAGARAARIDSLLITNAGIHKDDFAVPAQQAVSAGPGAGGESCNAELAPQAPSLLHTVLSFCEEHGYHPPTFILPWLR